MGKYASADITGQKFGRWTAIRPTGRKAKNGTYYWLCKCECGNIGEVSVSNLRSGSSKSCGCIPKERMSKLNYKHGGKKERLYLVWIDMRRRCYDDSVYEYMNYGGRGIAVCDEWQDYSKFREWALSTGYDAAAKRTACTLDRIDVNGNYCPENCRWADSATQNNNRRNNKKISYGSETHSMAEWNRICNFPKNTIFKRINAGWSPEKAITTPLDYTHHPRIRNGALRDEA